MRALETIGDEELLTSVVDAIAMQPKRFPPGVVVRDAVFELVDSSSGTPLPSSVQRLWKTATEFLLARSERPIAPPKDWAQNVPIKCGCADCAELLAFLRDPVQQVGRFKMAKERRRHLHHQLDSHSADVRHETERIGSPQTLVCTKNRRSFEARLSQRAEDVVALHRLAKLGGRVDAARHDFVERAAAVRANP